jgi:hypothetical protein
MFYDPRDIWPEDVPIGTYDIELKGVEGYPGANAHIIFVCPNKKRCSILLGPVFVKQPNKDALNIWAWDGNVECPTISPSINCIKEKDGKPTGGCGWHGHIHQGVMS